MILTKDNLLRFVREKKYVTPTNVAESFDTSTMIASAALSELAKDKQVLISDLKLGSSPYYYDPRQKDCLIELGEKHFSKYEREVFDHLKQQQVINDSSLSIQHRLAIEKIKDFAIPLEVSYQEKTLKFWVWFLRDIKETEKQINDVLKGQISSQKTTPKVQQAVQKSVKKESNGSNQRQHESIRHHQPRVSGGVFRPQFEEEEMSHENKVEMVILRFLRENYLKVEDKEVRENGTFYKASVLVNDIEVIFDCFHFYKKPKDPDIIKFYSASQNPKIIFIENAPKKFFKLAENLDNLTIVNI